VYFGLLCHQGILGNYGSCICRGPGNYEDLVQQKLKKELYNFQKDIPDSNCFIYLSGSFRQNGNLIEKTLTIAHEFQHIVQYSSEKTIFFQNDLIKQYLGIMKEWDNESYRSHPIEYDAFITSKRINNAMYGEDAVNNFLNEILSISRNDDKNYWEFIDSIDTAPDYDWISETNKLWEKYKADIERLYNEKIEAKADPFVENYEYLNSFGAE